MVELGQFEDVRRIERTHGGAQRLRCSAVDLQVLDTETTRDEVLGAEGGALGDDARRHFHRLVDVGQLLVFNQLAGHGRHRLRRLAQAGRGLGANADQARCVGAGVLGTLAHALPGYCGHAKFHRLTAHRRLRLGHQPVAVIATLYPVATAGQQHGETAVHRIQAMQAVALQAGQCFRGEGQRHGGLLGIATKRLGQVAGGHVEATAGGLLGDGRQGRNG
ncbi:hypothetical protein D3C78_1246500 [compost metagenome]